MKVIIKKETILKYMDEHHMTKNKFSNFCAIAVKTFDKFMGGTAVELVIGLKIAGYTKIEYQDLFEIQSI